MKKPFGIYIHIPFCSQKCPYCDFYSSPSQLALQKQYIETIFRQIDSLPNEIKADTLYFGGGTPSLLEPALLTRLTQKIIQKCSLSGEISLEANPGTVTEQKLFLLREAGFNRISFGMQSAVLEELSLLGRQHSPKQVEQAVLLARKAGFESVSVDLMLGIPRQTLKSAEYSLRFAIDLGIDHLSAYLLKIEPGTAFDCEEIRLLLPDEDSICDIYLQTCAQAELASLFQYEISNFSKIGKECRHNLKYWQGDEYLAFGPSAHGFCQGKRYYYPRSLTDYLQTNGNQPLIEEASVNSLEETILLGLRLKKGLYLPKLLETYRLPAHLFDQKIEQYLSYGLMEQKNQHIFLTPKGFLLSNTIIAELELLVENNISYK